MILKKIVINPEFGTCYYNGKTAYILDKPDSNQLYSGSTRCYRGQLITALSNKMRQENINYKIVYIFIL